MRAGARETINQGSTVSNFNKVILLGNLTRTPELRSTPGGTQVTDITLAVNENYTDSRGDKQERVTFVDITFWGKQAETLCRWKKQGDPLMVEGRLQQDKWNDAKTGEARSKLKVVGIGFVFIPRAGQGNASGNTSKPKSSGPPASEEDYASMSGYEEPPF